MGYTTLHGLLSPPPPCNGMMDRRVAIWKYKKTREKSLNEKRLRKVTESLYGGIIWHLMDRFVLPQTLKSIHVYTTKRTIEWKERSAKL